MAANGAASRDTAHHDGVATFLKGIADPSRRAVSRALADRSPS